MKNENFSFENEEKLVHITYKLHSAIKYENIFCSNKNIFLTLFYSHFTHTEAKSGDCRRNTSLKLCKRVWKDYSSTILTLSSFTRRIPCVQWRVSFEHFKTSSRFCTQTLALSLVTRLLHTLAEVVRAMNYCIDKGWVQYWGRSSPILISLKCEISLLNIYIVLPTSIV